MDFVIVTIWIFLRFPRFDYLIKRGKIQIVTILKSISYFVIILVLQYFSVVQLLKMNFGSRENEKKENKNE